MSKDYAQIANDVVNGVGLLRQGSPEAMKAFVALSTAGTATNAIDTKTKELMALAIGITTHCDGCVAYHTKIAQQHGATRQEVLETVALAVLHGGRAGGGLWRRRGARVRPVQRATEKQVTRWPMIRGPIGLSS